MGGFGLALLGVVISLTEQSLAETLSPVFQNTLHRIATVEKQAELACVPDRGSNETRVQIAEFVLSETSPAKGLLRELRTWTQHANHALAHADQMILKRYEPVWHRAVDTAALRVQRATPSSKPQLVQQYSKLIREGRDLFLLEKSAFAPQVQREIASLRDRAAGDLHRYLEVSDRVERAIHKTSVCHCKATNIRCTPIEEIRSKTELFKAIGEHRQAEQESVGRYMPTLPLSRSAAD